MKMGLKMKDNRMVNDLETYLMGIRFHNLRARMLLLQKIVANLR
jgi:hypothetical protein